MVGAGRFELLFSFLTFHQKNQSIQCYQWFGDKIPKPSKRINPKENTRFLFGKVWKMEPLKTTSTGGDVVNLSPDPQLIRGKYVTCDVFAGNSFGENSHHGANLPATHSGKM